MHDEFVLVKSKRNKRKKHTYIKPLSCTSSQSTPFDTVKLNRKLNDIIEHLELEQFGFELLDNINSALSRLSKSKVDNILCYGLGKFSESSCSLHQLAILVYLQRRLGTGTVRIFDPAFDCGEIDFLKTLKFDVIEENEEGKRVVGEDNLTLAFLPHCPKQLVNNFLWANWSENLRNCIVISNSFSKILERNSKRTITVSANYIAKSFDLCEEIPVEDNHEHPNVLNDTSIHIFPGAGLNLTLFQAPQEEPEYPEDTEFVTKSVGRLSIENEQGRVESD